MLRIELVNRLYGKFVCDPTRPGSADPIGINELITSVKRSEDAAGVIFEVTIDLGFILDAKPFVRNCFFNDGGIDAIVLVNLLEYNPNLPLWEIYATAKVNFNKFHEDDDKIALNFEQRGPQTDINNGKSLDVDLETVVSSNGSALPVQTVLNVPFHSKSIREQAVKETYYTDPTESLYEVDVETEASGPGTFFNGLITYALDRTTGNSTVAPLDKLLDEIENAIPTSNLYFNGIDGTNPVAIANWVGEANLNYSFKTAGHCKITVGARFKVLLDASFLLNVAAKIVYGRPGAYTIVVVGSVGGSGVNTLTLNASLVDYEFDVLAGDTLTVYNIIGGVGVASTTHLKLFPHPTAGPYKINLIQLTTFPETTTKGVLLFEAVERTLQYLCNQRVILQSTLLGRTDLGYAEDGEASLILWTNGNRIRGLNDKKIFANFTELIKFINANWCVSWGVRQANGAYVVLVEKLGFFFDRSTVAVSFGKLFGVETDLDSKRYVRQIKYGYSDSVNIKELNVIDEFNTIRVSELPLRNCSNTLDVSTSTKASGYEIEWLRRLSGTTEDSSNDDKNFAVCLVRNGGGYKTKKNEGYDFIDNVYEPETGYNYDISPGRALRNWLEYLSASLIYSSDKIIKFSSGDRNYLMASKKTAETFTVFENGPADVSEVNPIWDNFVYTVVNVPFPRDFFKLLKLNAYGLVEFKDKNNVTFKGYISSDSSDVDSSNGTIDLKLLKAFIP